MRAFRINGEAMVGVRFGSHRTPASIYSGYPSEQPLSGLGTSGYLYELGLSVEQVTVKPLYFHRDVSPDDYGGNVPAEVIANLAEVQIGMTLIHHDSRVLSAVQQESMGAGLVEGRLGPAGALMGGGGPLGSSGNHFMSLSIASPVALLPYRFPASYLAESPIEIPLGTQKSMVVLNWRAVPYRPLSSGSVFSEGATLWDRRSDVGESTGTSTVPGGPDYPPTGNFSSGKAGGIYAGGGTPGQQNGNQPRINPPLFLGTLVSSESSGIYSG